LLHHEKQLLDRLPKPLAEREDDDTLPGSRATSKAVAVSG
jgi:hypothetical protein